MIEIILFVVTQPTGTNSKNMFVDQNVFPEANRRSLLSRKTIDPFVPQTMSDNDREPGG